MKRFHAILTTVQNALSDGSIMTTRSAYLAELIELGMLTPGELHAVAAAMDSSGIMVPISGNARAPVQSDQVMMEIQKLAAGSPDMADAMAMPQSAMAEMGRVNPVPQEHPPTLSSATELVPATELVRSKPGIESTGEAETQ